TAEDAADRLLSGRREARWHDAALLVRLTPGFDPHRCRDLWSGLRDLNGPLILAVSPQDGPAVLNGAPRGFLPLTPPPPTLAERAALWRALLPVAVPIADHDLASLAARFHFGAGAIAKSVERASAEAAATPGPSTPTAPLFASAARALGVERMSALAQRL